ncbi:MULTISPECIES: hypothetical protein [Pseudomonadaceae]|uniref:Uncharacterized protein n=1 Tax=Ectopseudomonas alcaliphila TaxID=101564 RepID=A0ABU4PWQ0_9GAMM|nr:MULTISPECIES: hypothetical protein [Pseudomonas]MDH1538674.1 hypothetical protein [Pseudomonas chengduensis]MDP9939990.1 hypothetical protein [Pseudomonas sp. 3400]MDR7012443.1 hypothetical protein [Pseudomonas alcaliphila]MDX5991299.1 hypothetical protein [Pseudomonas alcaliphila]
MSGRALVFAGLTVGLGLLLALAWWGWRQGGLALLQLGVGIC